MLQFFRKYQKYFFIVITVVIVSTFVFFGTYQAVSTGLQIQGETKDYASQMVDFLNSEQWMVSGRLFEANFLNDGVVSKEFLETGVGHLAAALLDNEALYLSKWEKERLYIPYAHPYIPSLNAQAIWSIFAPEIPEKLKAFQQESSSFQDRCALFLAQKQFPPALLSQVIRYQEQSAAQAPLDPRLAREDITIFGYQTLSDWFGEPFMQAVAHHIIDLAHHAKKLGYRVSKEELLTDLVARSQEFYDTIKHQIDFPVHDGYGMFQLYIRHLGLSEERVLNIWRDVTLFRRLMQSIGDAALIDPHPLDQFYAFAHANARIELYQMPEELRFHSLDEWKQFEAYILAVGESQPNLEIPKSYAPLSEIEQRAPQLVGRRYDLSFAMMTKKDLPARIGLKELLQWECDPLHWPALQRQFPELAGKIGDPFDILEAMDFKGRRLVDAYARTQIVEEHPEWITEALHKAPLENRVVFLSKGGKTPFMGIDSDRLRHLIDQQGELIGHTEDGIHFYRVKVNEKGSTQEILSYASAKKEGFLSQLTDKLEIAARIETLQARTPAAYREQAYLYRLAPFLKQNCQTLPSGSLVQQFAPIKKEKTLTRSDPSFLKIEEVLAKDYNALSDVSIDPLEGPYCYQVLECREGDTLPLDKLLETQKALSQEVRRHYFDQWIKMGVHEENS